MDPASIIQILNQIAIQIMPTLLVVMMIAVTLCIAYITAKVIRRSQQRAIDQEIKEQQPLKLKPLNEEAKSILNMEDVKKHAYKEYGEEHMKEPALSQGQQVVSQERQNTANINDQTDEIKALKEQSQESRLEVKGSKVKEVAEVSKKLPVSKITFKEIEEAKEAEDEHEVHEENKERESAKSKLETSQQLSAKPHGGPHNEVSMTIPPGIKTENSSLAQEVELDKGVKEGKSEFREAHPQEYEDICKVTELLTRSEESSSSNDLNGILIELANSLRLLKEKLSKLEVKAT